MAERFLAEACDGFVVMPTYHPEGSDLFFSDVPILQEKGLFRREYRGSSLRSHFGLKCRLGAEASFLRPLRAGNRSQGSRCQSGRRNPPKS